MSRSTLEQIYQIAVDEWRENLKDLEKIKAKIDSHKSWLELYHSFAPFDIGGIDTISLYRQEIEKMRLFFSKQGFIRGDLCSSLEITEMPAYLRSVRGSASFSAAFSADAREKSYFYITTSLPRQNNSKAGKLLKRRLNREYKFLTAHETIPGHHLLDSIRRSRKNPVRRQIESPLFYEGWAYYAESLLTEYGYVDRPIEMLVDCKPRLWRSARCQIDVGLTYGIINREDAVKLLITCGFSKQESKRQINRFQLNPGSGVTS